MEPTTLHSTRTFGKYVLRDYQDSAVQHCLDWLQGSAPGSKLCVEAPTGTGKSVVELVLATNTNTASRNTWIITPRLEIVAGLMEKSGLDANDLSEGRLVAEAWERKITTPLRLHNAMLRGDMPYTPDLLIVDEGHHYNAETYQRVELMAGACPAIAFTATPYRGTPRGTAEFRKSWGEPYRMLSISAAIARGVWSLPHCRIVPLCDDDEVKVENGEFVITEAAKQVRSRLSAIVDMCRQYVRPDGWDRPTMFAVPNTEAAHELTAALLAAGIPACCVTQETTARSRRAAFESCVNAAAALVQINVVSEGVDLPIRRLIDLAPMFSPVRWLQQFGRITRLVYDGEPPPEYVCLNRNLLRHAYLLDGAIPPAQFAEAAAQFESAPSKRAGIRVLGFESVGRLKPIELPLAGGLTGHLYAMSSVQGHTVTEYAALAHPLRQDVIWARRTRCKVVDGHCADWGKWSRCEAPSDVTGYSSVPPAPLTEKMAAWWNRDAARYGLDPDAKINRKNFVALPVLSNIRDKM